MGDGQAHPIGCLVDGRDPGSVVHPETPLATDPFPVLAVVEVGDQWGIYCRIVGVAVVVDQLPPDFGGRSIEVIDRRRIEDPVGIGAVVGRAIAIPRENRVHLRAGILTVQIRHRLGRTLTGTHHRDAGGRDIQSLEPV